MILFIVLLSIVSSTLCTRYEWNEDWRAVNNASLQEFRAGQGYGTFRLVVASPGVSVVSENATLGLAFLNFNGTGEYYMSVMLGVETGAAVPIWIANRNSPLPENCQLQLLSGQMRLVDSQGNRVWSPYKTQIRGLELSSSGNLRLFDDQNTTVWQTFDNPTDVLMPGQRFTTGSKLLANSAKSNLTQGAFVMSMEASGVALYLTSPNSQVDPQPYSVFTMQNTTARRQLSTVLRECNGYRAVFIYAPDGKLKLEYEAISASTTPSAPCDQPLTVPLPYVNNSRSLRFLRFEYTGDMVSYGYDPQNIDWQADFRSSSFLSSKVCPYPLSCGAYGMCQSTGAPCKCFSQETQQYDIDSNTPCPSIQRTPGSCSQAQHFVDVLGVKYFSNKLLQPDITSSSVDECLRMCMSNCSCAAVFYSKNSSGCFFVDQVLGSLDFDATTVVQNSAHLKMISNSITSDGNSFSTSEKVATAAGVAAFVILCGVILFLWLQRRRSALKEARIITFLLNALPGSPPHRFSLKTLKLATKGFTEKLGMGGFGSVYAGTLSDGRKLAVKSLETTTLQGEKEFIAEVVTLGSVSHVNVVRLCGYCVRGSWRLLVYEYVVNGSLDKWLFNAEKRRSLTWERRWNIALGTARGLLYLHEECNESIIHLDIKPHNILLDEDFTAKVADFGLSKLLRNRDITQVVTGVRGTPGYLAPEWLVNSIATKKCDVYSYGMVLLELLSGRRNAEPSMTPGTSMSAAWYFPLWAVNQVKQGRTMNAVDEMIRHEEVRYQVEKLFKVALWCIQDNPALRPSMTKVVQMLEGQCDVPQPPLVFHFQQQRLVISRDIQSSPSDDQSSLISYSTTWSYDGGDRVLSQSIEPR